MGPSPGDKVQRHPGDVFVELANKAGYEVIIPQVSGENLQPPRMFLLYILCNCAKHM
jgi:hypothetical protein